MESHPILPAARHGAHPTAGVTLHGDRPQPPGAELSTLLTLLQATPTAGPADPREGLASAGCVQLRGILL